MCRTDFERRIFHDSYKEFQKKSKVYSLNNTLHTFSQMLGENEKANELHQKLNFSVLNTIVAQENAMPVLSDLTGKAILFDSAELHIYSSDLLNKAGHVVSITYTSKKLVLHEIVGDILIVSYDIKGNFNKTFMIKMMDDLVVNYQQKEELVYN